MSNLRYPNNYYKNRSGGIRYRLETEFLNKIQYYINTEIRPFLDNLAKLKVLTNNPDYFHERMKMLEDDFENKIEDLAMKHFRDILKLSLVEKYGAWHKVPWQEVSQMLGFLWKQSNYAKKSRYFASRIFREAKPLFKQSIKEFHEEGHDPVSEAVNELFNKRMSMISQSIYTHSTYFINSAYEIQFRDRDPLDQFRYIWGTRPDHRRTLQCEMIDKKVKDEAKKKKDKGVKLDRLEEIVNEVANMEGFKKANPNIKWTPHYNCRSGIERVV